MNKDLLLNEKNRTGLVVVAHPDDETIWTGGVLLMFSRINWTIFSLCRKNDKDRCPKFKQACSFFKTKAIISDLEDEALMDLKDSLPLIKQRLAENLKRKTFDYLLTHGFNGEYGHLRHIGVYQAVNELLQEKKLQASQVFHFCYQGENKGDNSHAVNDLKKAAFFLRLSGQEKKQKQWLVSKIYGFSKNSFEYLSCLGLETFI